MLQLILRISGEPNKVESDWSKGTMRDLVMKNDEDIVRAYSMASILQKEEKSC